MDLPRITHLSSDLQVWSTEVLAEAEQITQGIPTFYEATPLF